MKKDTRTPCNRQSLVDGQFITCPGVYEVRVPVYFDRDVTEENGYRLLFTALGGGEGTEGVVINCTECGQPAPRIYYAGIALVLQELEEKLRGVLD